MFRVLTVVLLLAAVAHGQIILQIDYTDPANAMFISLPVNSAVNDSTTDIKDGLTLDSFFTGSTPIIPAPPVNGIDIGGDIIGGLALGRYNVANNENLPDTSLNLWANAANPVPSQNFSTASPALTGTGTADLETLFATLPLLNDTGDVLVGNGVNGSGNVIGQWEVTAVGVPEPSAFLFLGLIVVGVGLWKRFSRP